MPVQFTIVMHHMTCLSDRITFRENKRCVIYKEMISYYHSNSWSRNFNTLAFIPSFRYTLSVTKTICIIFCVNCPIATLHYRH